LDSLVVAVAADKDGAAVRDGDEEWQLDRKRMQTSIPYNRTITGYQVHTAHLARVLTKIFKAGKVKAPVDSVRASKDHEVHTARSARVLIKISRAGKVKAPADSVRASRDHEVHTARSARVLIKISRAGKVKARVDLVRAVKAEDLVVSARVSRAEVWAHTARATDART